LRQDFGNRGHAAYRCKWSEEAHLTRYFEIIDQISESGGTA